MTEDHTEQLESLPRADHATLRGLHRHRDALVAELARYEGLRPRQAVLQPDGSIEFLRDPEPPETAGLREALQDVNGRIERVRKAL